MRTVTRLLFPSLALALCAARASAQHCLGSVGFEDSRYQVGAMGLASNGMKGWAAGGGSGTNNGDFLRISLGQSDYDNLPFIITSYSLVTGYQFPVQGSMKMELCPYLMALNEKGTGKTSTGARTGVNSSTVAVGGALGWVAFSSRDVKVLPSASAEFRYLSGGGTGALQGTTGSRRNSFFLATVSLGVTIRDRVTILPSASVPLAIRGAKTVYSLGASFSFSRGMPR